MVAIMRKRIPYNPELCGIVGQLSLLFCCSNPTFSKLALARDRSPRNPGPCELRANGIL